MEQSPDSSSERNLTMPVEGVEELGEADRRWSQRLEQAQLDALPTARESAQRWVATSSAILGTLGLAAALAGPAAFNEITGPWRQVGKVLLFVGAGLGLIGLCMAGSAASASRLKLGVASGVEFRQESVQVVEKVLNRLKISQACTGVAVIAVILAALFVWFAPRVAEGGLLCRLAEPTGKRAEHRNDAVFCRSVRGDWSATSGRADEP
jgi:hypothetical protein